MGCRPAGPKGIFLRPEEPTHIKTSLVSGTGRMMLQNDNFTPCLFPSIHANPFVAKFPQSPLDHWIFSKQLKV
jgi:hypothetical protein